ncbi:MAG: hypothetical protein QHC78_16780 [Pigmentiphaga sp.]|uniref:hypothetical protein n=1 Tax=Pigmentiphaga sp. TaxID=1977564 RepID=UPI0029AC033D|nr:hypothetical protein [Pigmentiphaga sp.]MDX3907347.1 hypothetical protein [Pigmentiphaga sp.]
MSKQATWRVGAVAAGLLLLFCHVEAAEAELGKVREMLRLDTERALAAERSRQGSPKGASPAPARRGDRLVLSSIHGLRGDLSAVVLVNGEAKLYRQGRDLPRGTVSPAHEYRLQRIDEDCVYLRKGRTGERSACFTPPQLVPPRRASEAPGRPAVPPQFPLLVPPPGGRP